MTGTNPSLHFRLQQVRRGGCHFAEKVKIAQDSKGASAVIIVDEAGSRRTPNDIKTIIMADGELKRISESV